MVFALQPVFIDVQRFVYSLIAIGSQAHLYFIDYVITFIIVTINVTLQKSYMHLDNALQNCLDNAYKIVLITIIILINNDAALRIFSGFYHSKIALYTNTPVCFCVVYSSIQKFTIITIIKTIMIMDLIS